MTAEREEVITPTAKREAIQRRIGILEMDLFNYELSVVEFTSLADSRTGGKTDAGQALYEARVGVESTRIRLEAMRAEYKRLFPDGAVPEKE